MTDHEAQRNQDSKPGMLVTAPGVTPAIYFDGKSYFFHRGDEKIPTGPMTALLYVNRASHTASESEVSGRQ